MATNNNINNENGNNNGKSRRGFASMSPQEREKIASMGGKAAHEKGTAHEFNSKEAQEAGRKGGQARQGNRGVEHTETEIEGVQ